ncbi:MAG: hypothetical protein ACLFWB_10015 [Armatimonadota bacterium]
MQQGTGVQETTGIDAQAVATYAAMMLAFSAALVITDGIIRTPIGVPGHSAVFWIPVLVLAGAQKRSGIAAGSSVLAGSASLLWFGGNVGGVMTLAAAGVVIEVLAAFKHTDTLAVWMVLAGLAAHFGKLAIKVLMALVMVKPLNLAGLQLVETAVLYAAFGIIGGAIAWTMTSAGRTIAEKTGIFSSKSDA